MRIRGDSLLVLLNPHHDTVEFTLPAIEWASDWEIAVDTARAEPIRGKTPAGGKVELIARSMMILRHALGGGD